MTHLTRNIPTFGLLLAGFFLFLSPAAFAATEAEGAPSHGTATIFLWLALILVLAKLGALVERWGQPAVLGELLVGVLLGNLALFGVTALEPLEHDAMLKVLAEIGVVILLFQIGLESNIEKMKKVGARALLVACVGVAVPFALGYFLGQWLFPELGLGGNLFLGATLTATSVGITARVFKDLNFLQAPEAQIVLGAAVIDDVLGLIILSIVSAIVEAGTVSVGAVLFITLKSFIFLAGAIILGQIAAPRIGSFLSRIHTGTGMKLTFAVSFAFLFAYLAGFVGLAPIVGAFAAGLVLDPVHFRTFKKSAIVEDVERELHANGGGNGQMHGVLEHHAERHIEDLVEPIGYLLVPLFFVMTGLVVQLETLANPAIIGVALLITLVAFFGKIVSGAVAGPVQKWVVGWGMAPRGEVGLIFALTGRSLGVVSDAVYSAIVIMVILTTLLTPPILTYVLRRRSAKQSSAETRLRAA